VQNGLNYSNKFAPSVSRVAVIRNPENPVGLALFSAIQAAAQPLGIEVSPIDSRRDAGEIERVITIFAHSPNGGLILTPKALGLSVPNSLIGRADHVIE
jgi:hypothetical protein